MSPTDSAGGRPATIPEALLATAERGAGEYVFHLEEGEVRLTCEELVERAERGARRLAALDVQPGDAVGLVGPNRPEWIVWAFATWFAGAVLIPIQIPLRVREPGAFRERLRSLVAVAGCRRVLADPGLATLLSPEVVVPWVEGGRESAEPLGAPSAEDIAVIQFTSGSTASPRGAALRHSTVMAQVAEVLATYRRDGGSPRSILSWTPFFHDLGLFANVVQPAYSGAMVHQLPTERFARDPAEWLRLVERTGVALTVGPSSAIGSALRALARRSEAPNLGSLEILYFAAEGVDPEVARRLLDSSSRFNLDPCALGSTYGLAEAVMAVSYSVAGSGLSFDRVSLRRLADEGVAVPAGAEPLRALASCGPPLMDLRIAEGGGGEAPERHIGEIQVRGASVMSGYVGDGAPAPFVDGWLRTGDLGYLAGGELYVTGRKKDIVISAGHNYYPEDFEWAAGRVDGVRPGRCVAFGLSEREQVVVLVEPRNGSPGPGLERDVARAVADAVGVRPHRVLVLPRGTIEKTTSGKLRRAAMRAAYERGGLTDGAR